MYEQNKIDFLTLILTAAMQNVLSLILLEKKEFWFQSCFNENRYCILYNIKEKTKHVVKTILIGKNYQISKCPSN